MDKKISCDYSNRLCYTLVITEATDLNEHEQLNLWGEILPYN
jgi:hypothetical protein